MNMSCRLKKDYTHIMILVIFVMLIIAVNVQADCSVTFSWLPNPDTEQVQGYKIHYGTSQGGPYTETVEVGNPAPVDGRISWTIDSGFTENTTYYFVATAYNGAGESAYSIEQQWRCDNTSPADVTNVKFNRNGDNVAFEWKNPVDSDYAGVKIVYTDDGTEPALDTAGNIVTGQLFSNVTAPANATSAVLPPDKTYNFSFFTYDSSGNYSHTFKLTIPAVSVSYVPNPVSDPKTEVMFSLDINPECLEAVTYEWNFGDGSDTQTVSTKTVKHSFATSKTYNVTLTLTNQNGSQIIKTIPITVNDLPPSKPTNPH